MAESQLDVLNRAPVEQAAGWLAACNGSGHWIERVLAGRPYPDADALLSAAERTVRSLHRRLANDERSERAEVTDQLAQITRLRLGKLLAR